jgi:ABC-type Zn2+ transport system substrate-binding protein/surface adhesin
VTRKRPIALAAVLGLLSLPLLPQEHVHVTESESGEHSEIVHRHFASHHPGHVEHEADHHDADRHDHEFDHQDEAALWIDAPFVARAPASAPLFTPVVVQELPVLQPQPLPRWTLEFEHISVHDPPWVASIGLRAPPASLV